MYSTCVQEYIYVLLHLACLKIRINTNEEGSAYIERKQAAPSFTIQTSVLEMLSEVVVK